MGCEARGAYCGYSTEATRNETDRPQNRCPQGFCPCCPSVFVARLANERQPFDAARAALTGNRRRNAAHGELILAFTRNIIFVTQSLYRALYVRYCLAAWSRTPLKCARRLPIRRFRGLEGGLAGLWAIRRNLCRLSPTRVTNFVTL